MGWEIGQCCGAQFNVIQHPDEAMLLQLWMEDGFESVQEGQPTRMPGRI